MVRFNAVKRLMASDHSMKSGHFQKKALQRIRRRPRLTFRIAQVYVTISGRRTFLLFAVLITFHVRRAFAGAEIAARHGSANFAL